LLEQAIPTSILTLLSSFQGCFSKPGYKNFVALAVGWILCQGRHSISRVIQAGSDLTQNKHHSTFYRFLSRGRWEADHLGERVFHLVERFLPFEITAIVDDTLCHKGGPHIFGACMHYDAANSTYGRGTNEGAKKFFAFGHNWVVLAVWVPLPWIHKRGLALPILFRLYRSKKRSPERQYRKRTELARELVRILLGWLPARRPLHIVGDGEYACETLVRDLPEGIFFTGPIVMDAAVFARPRMHKKQNGRGRPRKKGKRLLSPRRLAASRRIPWEEVTLTIYGREITILTKTQMCMWYGAAGTRWGRMVITRDPTGRIKDRAFFSTKPDSSVGDVLVQFAYRWEIEVMFRNVKQVVGLQDPQNGWWRAKSGRAKKKPGPNPRGLRGKKAIVHTLALALTAYDLIVIWYFSHGEGKADVARVRAEAPWYLHKVNPSFNDMLAAIRRELWSARFSAHPLLRQVSEKIRDLLPNWLLAA
jgi:hypothetical protein